jgi:hypothetical protein
MIAVYLLTKEEVERRLKKLGCVRIKCEIEEHGMWKAPWGHAFLLPELPPDGMCAERTFNAAVEELEKTKPVNH